MLSRPPCQAFVEFVNRDVGKFKNADLMCSFCDRILKTGGEKLGDAEVEEYLAKVVQLFSYLTDKDLFAEIYRNQLARRLLNSRSASDDMERLMIGKAVGEEEEAWGFVYFACHRSHVGCCWWSVLVVVVVAALGIVAGAFSLFCLVFFCVWLLVLGNRSCRHRRSSPPPPASRPPLTYLFGTQAS